MSRLIQDALVPAGVSRLLFVEANKLGCVDILGRTGNESTLGKRTEVDIFVEDSGAGGAEGIARVEVLELSAGGGDGSEELHYNKSIINI